jgi:hypothetical protein
MMPALPSLGAALLPAAGLLTEALGGHLGAPA